MARYPLNLPQQLKQDAEAWAKSQGVSLNQFILWATAEKVGALSQQLDDPTFPQVTYRRGADNRPVPILRGTGIRVQSLWIAHKEWGLTSAEIGAEYDISQRWVEEALAFCAAHPAEIEDLLAVADQLTRSAHGAA